MKHVFACLFDLLLMPTVESYNISTQLSQKATVIFTLALIPPHAFL
jgi:hypothetical protein